MQTSCVWRQPFRSLKYCICNAKCDIYGTDEDNVRKNVALRRVRAKTVGKAISVTY